MCVCVWGGFPKVAMKLTRKLTRGDLAAAAVQTSFPSSLFASPGDRRNGLKGKKVGEREREGEKQFLGGFFLLSPRGEWKKDAELGGAELGRKGVAVGVSEKRGWP